MLPLTHGHPYFDNRTTVYTGAVAPAILAAIIAGVERFDATPDALEYLEHYYEPAGNLGIPMLMLSDARDPIAPGLHQIAYRDAVNANGNPDLLVQRQVATYGHCVFTPAQLGAALADLVLWVEFGIKPTP